MAPASGAGPRPGGGLRSTRGAILPGNSLAGTWAASERGPSGAEHVAEPEDVSQADEDVAEVGEDRGVDARAACAPDGGVPEPVVRRPLVGVGKDGVRLGALLELFFRGFVAGVAVGMIFE